MMYFNGIATFSQVKDHNTSSPASLPTIPTKLLSYTFSVSQQKCMCMHGFSNWIERTDWMDEWLMDKKARKKTTLYFGTQQLRKKNSELSSKRESFCITTRKAVWVKVSLQCSKWWIWILQDKQHQSERKCVKLYGFGILSYSVMTFPVSHTGDLYPDSTNWTHSVSVNKKVSKGFRKNIFCTICCLYNGIVVK